MFHNIKLYPYESDEDDEQEQALNESIRVRVVNDTSLVGSLILIDIDIGAAAFCHRWLRAQCNH